MAGKSALKKEKEAWEDYLHSIEAVEKERGKKKSLGERVRGFFAGFKFWKREKKEVVLPEKVEQGIAKAPGMQVKFGPPKEKEPGKKPEEKARAARLLEKTLAEIEKEAAAKKKAREARPPAWKRPAEAVRKLLPAPKKLLPERIATIAKAGPGEKKEPVGKPFFRKPKIELALKKEKEEKETLPAKKPKVEMALKPKKGLEEKGKAKAITKKKGKLPLEKAPAEVQKAVKIVRMAEKARGWYGDRMRHKKVALEGWRLRKKVRIYALKKKAKKKRGLSNKEKKQMERLLKEEKGLVAKIADVNRKMGALRTIGKEIKIGRNQLLQTAKAAGIDIPRGELAKGKAGKEDLAEMVNAVKAVAGELAKSVVKVPLAPMKEEEQLDLDNQIASTQKMIKSLEFAFYKRKISLEQFREKLFEYQTKLSELKLKKQFLGKIKKEGKIVGAARPVAAMEAAKAEPMGISPIVAKALEKMAGERRIGISKKAEKALEKIVEMAARPKERIVERVIERRAGEGAAAKAPAEREVERIIEEEPAAPARGARPGARAGRGAVLPAPAARPRRREERRKPAGKEEKRKETEERLWEEPAKKQEPLNVQPVRVVGPFGRGTDRILEAEAAAEKEAKAAEQVKQVAAVKAAGQAAVQVAAPGPVPVAVQGPGRAAKGKKGEAAGAVPAGAAVGAGRQAGPFAGAGATGMPAGKELRVAMPRPGQEVRPGKGRVREIEKPATVKRVEKMIEKKAGGKISKEQIDRIEGQVGNLLKRYNIPEKQMERQIEALDSTKLVEDFHKLINLIVVQQGQLGERPIMDMEGYAARHAITPKKKEKLTAREKEIVKLKIETEFDKLLNLIKMKGIIGVNEASKELGISKDRVQEASKILEQNRLVQLVFPPIGQMKLAFPGYLRWKEKEKERKKQEKKKKKEEEKKKKKKK